MNTSDNPMDGFPEETTVEDVMERSVLFFEKETKCNRLLCAMLEGHAGAIPVVNGRRQLIGSVSENALLAAMLSGEDLLRLEAKEIMNPTYAVSTHCSIVKASRMMRENGLHRVPVVDYQNRLIGVVTDGGVTNGGLDRETVTPGPCERKVA